MPMSTKEYPYINAPQSPYDLPPLSRQEDEVSFLDLILVFVKHKRLILGMVFFAGFLAVNISLGQENLYRSEATIAPRKVQRGVSAYSAFGALGGFVANQVGLNTGGSLDRMEIVLNSRELTMRVIEKYQLMPVIFPERGGTVRKRSPLAILLSAGESESKAPGGGYQPSLQDAYQRMRGSLQVNADKMIQTIQIGYVHPDPWTAHRIVSYYLTELSETLRGEVLRDAEENKRFIREQIDRTNDILLKEKLYTMLANEIEKEIFARAQTYFSFIVLDQPIVPDRNKKVGPRRGKFCVFFVAAAFFVAVVIAFVKEFLHRARQKDPARYGRLVRGLRLRKARRSA
jgi:uncharacterized protein involved in exopolysaccharide biosynthesis